MCHILRKILIPRPNETIGVPGTKNIFECICKISMFGIHSELKFQNTSWFLPAVSNSQYCCDGPCPHCGVSGMRGSTRACIPAQVEEEKEDQDRLRNQLCLRPARALEHLKVRSVQRRVGQRARVPVRWQLCQFNSVRAFPNIFNSLFRLTGTLLVDHESRRTMESSYRRMGGVTRASCLAYLQETLNVSTNLPTGSVQA